MKAPFRIAELGSVAARALRARARGRVVSVFERSVYIEIGNALICVGVPQLGSGPLNALLACDAATRRLRGLAEADVVCDGQHLLLADVALDFIDAREWHPPPLPLPIDVARLARGIAQIRRVSRRCGLDEGLAFLVRRTVWSSPLATAAQPAIQDIHDWLRPRDADAAPPASLAALIGLGPGLTPSGDDFLGGALIALRAFGENELAARLAALLRPLVMRRTHPISAAHFDAACAGFGSDALHACLHDMVVARDPRRSLAAIAAIGHTSGWDALAGAMTVADAIAGVATRQSRVA